MLPALMRAEKVGKKASCFDFGSREEVMDKVREELLELDEAIAEGEHAHVEEEMGDLLLTLTSLCRKIGVEPEVALSRATDKFICRFETLENAVIEAGKDINSMSMTELDAVWDEIKHKNA